MHHYPFHIGDYLIKTAHLSVDEDCAYRRLLDLYYESELPIPNETQTVSKRIRMANHQDTVAYVLQQYFMLHDDGMWHQSHCDEVISAYHLKCKHNRDAGLKGGRPKNPNGFQRVPKNNPNQEPITNNQEPINTLVASDAGRPVCPHEKIIELYHKHLPMLSQVRIWNEKRKAALKARWNEDSERQNLEYWERLFVYISQSDFLCGRAGSFMADLEWIVNSSNLVKIIEGKYENRKIV